MISIDKTDKLVFRAIALMAASLNRATRGAHAETIVGEMKGVG